MADVILSVRTRAQARRDSLSTYFTGRPCKHGHVCERRTINGSCVECCKSALKKYKSTPRAKELNRARLERTRARRLELRRAWYQKNIESVRASGKRYAENNRDKLRAKSAAYRASHLDKCREYDRQRVLRDPDGEKERHRDYYHRNRDKLLEKQRASRRTPTGRAIHAQRARAYRRTNIGANIKNRVQRLVHKCLRDAGIQKRRTFSSLMGYTPNELRAHLERQFTRGMTWEKFMAGQIHIDHIVPVSAFDIKDEAGPEFRACWSLANLRPMWAADNISKGAQRRTLV